MFKHVYYENVKPEKLVREEVAGIRHYRDAEGNLFRSVTAFLSRFSDDSIQKWREAVGEETANRISRMAATKGTNIHLACEKFLNNEADYRDHMFYDEMYDWKIMEPVLKQRVNNIVAQEIMMKSKKLRLAGTADCIAEVDGVLSLVDFKTSKRVKSKEDIWGYWIQCAAYSIMAYEQFGLRINQLCVIMLVNQDQVLVYKEPAIKWMKEILKLTADYNGE